MAKFLERTATALLALAKDIESHCECDPIPEDTFIEYDNRVRELAGSVPMCAVNGVMRASDLLYQASLWPHLDSTRYAYIEAATACLRNTAEVVAWLPER
jgi:hypothetical protein